MQRRKMVAANWKMNLTLPQGEALLEQIIAGLPGALDCDVVIAPPFTHIPMLVAKAGQTVLQPAAQHCHFKDSGAFTGEISVDMLKSAGVQYVITGHSERRQLFHETNAMIRAKVEAILHGALIPVFCCGEPLDIRQAGHQNDYVKHQLEESLFGLTPDHVKRVIIAYEPIWAIGTGVNATPEQAQQMHAYIRRVMTDQYGTEISQAVRVLYGGSIKAENASDLFSQPDVDGGLVGGASLQASGFLRIIEAAC